MAPAAAAPAEFPPGTFDDQSGMVIGVVVFCLLVSTMMVALRLFTRIAVVKEVGLDDYAAVVSLVRSISFLLVFIVILFRTTYWYLPTNL